MTTGYSLFTSTKQTVAKYAQQLVGTLGVVLFFSALPVPLHASSISVYPISPEDGSIVKQNTVLRASVDGATPDTFEMFWAVDDGAWNRMHREGDSSVYGDTIDTSSWKWRADNTYRIRYIVLQKSDWQPVEKSITIHTNMQMTFPSTGTDQNVNSAGTLYVDTGTSAYSEAKQWADSHPSDRDAMNYLRGQPVAAWFGDWNDDVRSDVNAYVSRANQVGALPLVVTYNIPRRDCGSYSSGGSAGGNAYSGWINQFASGIGDQRAIVILEPDALSGMDCLSADEKNQRLDLISSAVTALKQLPRTTVYIDAGHPRWQPTNEVVDALKRANIDAADGFSLNVSNFVSTQDNASYGHDISASVGGKHFVIDTSRNGNGATSDSQWCNPSGRRVGQQPTLSTNDPLIDGYLWVKTPGSSDGTCGPSIGDSHPPRAGVWWPQYARDLAN